MASCLALLTRYPLTKVPTKVPSMNVPVLPQQSAKNEHLFALTPPKTTPPPPVDKQSIFRGFPPSPPPGLVAQHPTCSYLLRRWANPTPLPSSYARRLSHVPPKRTLSRSSTVFALAFSLCHREPVTVSNVGSVGRFDRRTSLTQCHPMSRWRRRAAILCGYSHLFPGLM
jgi:hypothetical protein